jgi:hypothetical protein
MKLGFHIYLDFVMYLLCFNFTVVVSIAMSVDGQFAVNNIVIRKYNQWKEKPQTLILIHLVSSVDFSVKVTLSCTRSGTRIFLLMIFYDSFQLHGDGWLWCLTPLSTIFQL